MQFKAHEKDKKKINMMKMMWMKQACALKMFEDKTVEIIITKDFQNYLEIEKPKRDIIAVFHYS